MTSGNIEIDLKYGIFPLPSETTPLCDAVSCPINTGTQTLSIVEKIPSAAPGVSTHTIPGISHLVI